MAYFGEEWSSPSRSDYYSMQIAAEIRGIFNKNVTVNSMKIPFDPVHGKRGQRPRKSTKEERDKATAIAKAAWAARVRMPTKKTVTKEPLGKKHGRS